MPATAPATSPAIQQFIDKGLFERLPVSFSAFCFDQLKDWDLLFPHERDYFERLFALLDRSDKAEVTRLFAPMRDAEITMGVNEKNWPKGQFTLEQVDFLNRNAHYPEWRAAVSAVFARLDPLLDSEIARTGHPRLVVICSPAELPTDPDRMWLRVASHGKRVAVQAPDDPNDFLPLLLTGQQRDRHAPSFASEYLSKSKQPYQSWVVEAGSTVTPEPGVVNCSYGQLEKYRRRLMTEVNRLVGSEEIHGPRELSARLKQMKVLASEGQVAADPILAEFTRATLLSGNGTLLINNTFVEWATVQAIRRARPSVMVIGFGIRNKVKPFSSLLIYADQEQINPIPTQMDTLGTYVDLEVLYQYVWQEFEKYVEYKRNTAYLFVGEGLDQMLVIAPGDFPLNSNTPVTLRDLHGANRAWLAL